MLSWYYAIMLSCCVVVMVSCYDVGGGACVLPHRGDIGCDAACDHAVCCGGVFYAWGVAPFTVSYRPFLPLYSSFFSEKLVQYIVVLSFLQR